MKNIIFTKIRDVISPTRANKNDAGIDFYVPKDVFYNLLPNEDFLMPSGIKVVVPEGYMLMAANKSGIATKKKLVVGAGIVDCGYEGEVHIHLFNNGPESVQIVPDMKIIQFILVPISTAMPEIVSNEEYNKYALETKTGRGENGFGSTG